VKRICIPIIEKTMEKALEAIGEAKGAADLIELRMDYVREPRLAGLLSGGWKPFIVTNRRKEEGGRYQGHEKKRLAILEEAIKLGADYVDVEIRTEKSLLKGLMANRKGTQIVLSFHDFKETPSQKELREIFNQMNRLGADVVKIVTFAKSWEDNLNVLSLIPYVRKRKQEVVAFCMGEKGKASRILAPLMGAVWTYASLNKDRISAPGQLTAKEMKEIWERLR